MQKLTYSKKWPKFILAQKYLQMCSFIFEFDACDIYTYTDSLFLGMDIFLQLLCLEKLSISFFWSRNHLQFENSVIDWERMSPHTLLPSIVHPKSFQSTTYVTFWIKNVHNRYYWMSNYENAQNSDLCYVPNVLLSFIFQI